MFVQTTLHEVNKSFIHGLWTKQGPYCHRHHYYYYRYRLLLRNYSEDTRSVKEPNRNVVNCTNQIIMTTLGLFNLR